MSYTNFNMRLDDNLRATAYPILEQYGLTPTQAVRMFFNQIAHTGEVPLSFNWGKKHTLSDNGKQLVQESLDAFANGDYTTYTSLDELNHAISEIANG